MNVVLAITGSSSVKLTRKLYGKLCDKGHKTKVIATDTAARLLEIYDLDCMRDLEISTSASEIDAFQATDKIQHVELAQWADTILIAPCTSNTLNKYISGICDNIVLSTLKAINKSRTQVMIAPAMNKHMFINDINKIYSVAEMDRIIYPTVKKLSCGDFGIGALANLDDIVNIVSGHFWRNNASFGNQGICGSFSSDSICRRVSLARDSLFGSKIAYQNYIKTSVTLEPIRFSKVSTPVTSFEEGKVVAVEPTINPNRYPPSLRSHVSVKGTSGIIVYGDVQPMGNIHIGDTVPALQPIGHALGRPSYFNVELLSHDAPYPYRSPPWTNGADRPSYLKDPTPYLFRP